ncbi:MAG: redoxin domain-containing protein [Chloroflexia bacterium]
MTDQPPRPTLRVPFRVWLLIVLIVGIATIAYFALLSTRPDTIGASPFKLRIGAVAPDFDLSNVQTDEQVKLSALRGRPVWINFWATWCPPCKAEMPLIQEKYSKYRDRGLAVIGIDMREDPAEVRAFTSANNFEWTFVVDSDGQVTNRYFMSGIPMHVFIDADGVIQALYVGDLQASSMEQFLSMIIN